MKFKQQKFVPIIESLLDTDLYKFTMQQAVMHQFPNASDVEFHFKCRDTNINMVQFIDEINRQIDHLCTLKFSEEELNFMDSLRYTTDDYIAFLSIFKLQRKYINIIALNENEIDVVIRGPWVHTILFEVPVLSIINEVYFRQTQNTEHFVTGRERLQVKIQKVCELNNKEFKFSDFGTRRRYSRDWQEEVIVAFKNALPDNFTGTSNVLFAMRHNLTPIGTMAHEFLQGCQALGPRLRDSQKFAFDKWVQEFRGDLGIALTDVIGMEAFCADFDLFFCKLFDGVRHDSGDPVIWGNRMIEHYESMKIDPKTKIFVFSDGLNIDKSIELFQTFYGKVKTFFGIGTNLTNDMGVKALNIVIKMTSCNGSPVAKISDSPGKSMCKNEEYLAYLRQVFSVK